MRKNCNSTRREKTNKGRQRNVWLTRQRKKKHQGPVKCHAAPTKGNGGRFYLYPDPESTIVVQLSIGWDNTTWITVVVKLQEILQPPLAAVGRHQPSDPSKQGWEGGQANFLSTFWLQEVRADIFVCPDVKNHHQEELSTAGIHLCCYSHELITPCV